MVSELLSITEYIHTARPNLLRCDVSLLIIAVYAKDVLERLVCELGLRVRLQVVRNKELASDTDQTRECQN